MEGRQSEKKQRGKICKEGDKKAGKWAGRQIGKKEGWLAGRQRI
jgi:hypothetical protein